MRTDFNSAWVVVKKWNEKVKEDDVIFFDYDDAVFYCEQKNQEDYNKSNNKDNYVRVFSVKTLYESMTSVIEETQKCGYDDGREEGYEDGRERGYDEGYDEGYRDGKADTSE
jgi:flagellar assembly protein FliH